MRRRLLETINIGPIDAQVEAIFSVTSTTSPTQITTRSSSYFPTYFSQMEIDGVVQPRPVSSYTFNTTGEHVVRYKFSSPNIIPTHSFSNCTELTSISADGITAIGTYAFENCTKLSKINSDVDGNFNLPSELSYIRDGSFYNCKSLKTVVVPSGITSIGNYAFDYCSGLTSINIPSGNTSIGNDAFEGCSAMTSCTFDENSQLTIIGNNAFFNCVKLKSISLSDKIETIGGSAFTNCTSLTSCTIPTNLSADTVIADSAFKNCTSLKSMNMPISVTEIGNSAFENCSAMSSCSFDSVSKLETVGESAFLNCTAMTTCNLDVNVNTIGASAFCNCYNLSASSIASGVTVINDSTFRECRKLKQITIPSAVTEIGNHAFYHCSAMTNCEFSDLSSASCVRIGDYAFTECRKLGSKSGETTTPIIVPSGMTYIGTRAFFNCSGMTDFSFDNASVPLEGGVMREIGNSAFTSCLTLSGMTIPESTSGIGEYAFSHCESLPTINITKDVSEIKSHTFYYCSGLTACTFDHPNSSSAIGISAFEMCSSLGQIEIPFNVEVIDNRAFWKCTSMTDCSFKSTSDTSNNNKCMYINAHAFRHCTSLARIDFPYGLWYVEETSFEDCGALESISVNGGKNGTRFYSSGDSINYNALIYKYRDNVWVVRGCKNSDISTINEIKKIGRFAFDEIHDSGFTSIELPNYIEEIGDCAFMNCEHLKMFNSNTDGECIIKSGVLRIYNDVFGNCAFKSVQIPSTVSAITSGAVSGYSSFTESDSARTQCNPFNNCSSISSITVDSNNTYYSSKEEGGINFNVIISKDGLLVSGCEKSIIPNEPFNNDNFSKVVEIGNCAFNGYANLSSCEINSGVTAIGASAFTNCSSMTASTVSGEGIDLSSVKYIGEYAFYGCENIESINGTILNNTIRKGTFENCTKLSNISIKYVGSGYYPYQTYEISGSAFANCVGLTSLPIVITRAAKLRLLDDVFKGCTGLTSVELDNSYSYVLSSAFKDCNNITSVIISMESVPDCFKNSPSLESVSITGTVASDITSGAFSGCTSLTSVSISSGVTTIGNYAFRNCNSLTSITFEQGSKLDSIGTSAFSGCTSLPSIDMPNGVTSISASAFTYCTSLTSVAIPNSVKSIGNCTFYRCSGLKSVTIGSGVTNIGDNVFHSCSSLTSMTVDSSNTTYDSRNNCNAIIKTEENVLVYGCSNTTIPNNITTIGAKAFYSCDNLTSISIPNNIMTIGDEAFRYCSGLTNCTIGNGVTRIGDYAFYNCSSLTSIKIPNSVTSISSYAFAYCSGLTSCTIGSGVTSIGNHAFAYCSDLEAITCNAASAPTITNYTFYAVKSRGTLKVPIGSSGYDDDGWRKETSYYLGYYRWTKVEQ